MKIISKLIFSIFGIILVCISFGDFRNTVLAVENSNDLELLEVTLDDNAISSSSENIHFSPKINQVYESTTTITNHSNETRYMKVFPSKAISSRSGIQYLDKSKNLLNESYNLQNYIHLELNGKELVDEIIEVNANEQIQLKIMIEILHEVKGEMLGGINFSQVLNEEENVDSIDIIQTYQKVINIRLKMSEFPQNINTFYDEFQFSTIQDNIVLQYYLYNINPYLTFADEGKYLLKNPNGNVIANGDFETGNVVLTPMTKTRLAIPLNNNAELNKGEYTFKVISDGIESNYKFKYSEKEIEDFANENKINNHVVVKVENQERVLPILVFIVVASLLGVLIYYKVQKNEEE